MNSPDQPTPYAGAPEWPKPFAGTPTGIIGETCGQPLHDLVHRTPTLAPTPRTLEAAGTPRTDSEEWTAGHGTDDRTVVWSDHARTLERELYAACSLQTLACRKWDAAERELSAAKAECERLRALGSWMHTCLNHTDAERKAGVGCWCCATAELARLRAEVERLTAKIGNQADRIRYLEGATNHATGTPLSQAIARAEKAEAERDALAKDKARLDWLEKNWIHWPITQNEETIRAAIDAAMKGTP